MHFTSIFKSYFPTRGKVWLTPVRWPPFTR